MWLNRTMLIRIVLFTMFLFPNEGHVGQPNPMQISLAQLAKISNTILVGKLASPTPVIIKIPLTSSKNSKEQKKYPEYSKAIYSYYVIEVLKNKTKIEIKEKIDVLESNSEAKLNHYRQVVIHKQQESIMLPTYEPLGPFETNNVPVAVVLFLTYDAKQTPPFSFTVEEAYESLARKNEILAHIR